MEIGIERQPGSGRDDDWRRLISDRLQRAAGIPSTSGRLAHLPAAFLRQSCPSPEQILARFPIRPRTRNVLRRFLAREESAGAWTYGRLLSIDRLGVATLLDVLEAGQRRPGDALSAQPRPPDPRTIFAPAVRLVLGQLPASDSEIRRRLLRAGMAGFVFGLRWLEETARMTQQPLPFAVIRREGLAVAVPSALEPLARTTLTLATRAVRTAGLASVRAIAQRAGTSSLRFVRKLVQVNRGFAWLDRAQDWFWFGNVRHRALQSLADRAGESAGPPASVRHALMRQLSGAV